MQDFFGSVRRSLVFRNSSPADDDGGFGGFVDKIGSSIRKSLAKPPLRQKALPPSKKAEETQIRWRKGELIGRGAFGTVYMGMNLDSGELLAVKQVLIAAHSASKETTQAHIRELEEEVKLLKNLSHPNIVRYLGTAREDDSLNIFLEFVPGGSISSLLGKFGSFPESVVRKYTKQLLLGLEYLHSNGIMHRDIKGANILVDNKACIKLADFGASKKVVELATMTGAKSMKGTPYWMAPEVILQTGHSFSADIWSVGCTIIEMATGKPPWSQQYQEVAALFHIGTTKSHPPIPEHISAEAKDFLLKCLQKEPDLRPTASELLQHPFVTGNYQESHPVFRNSLLASGNPLMASGMNLRASLNSEIRRSTSAGLKDVCEMGSMGCSTISACKLSGVGSTWRAGDMDDDMCLIDDKEDFGYGVPAKFDSRLTPTDLNKSFNPMCEPTEDWPCKFDESPEPRRSEADFTCQTVGAAGSHALNMGQNDLTFPCGTAAVDEDDEVTESKIKAFLDEKALDLKKLQTPLYEEFYNASNSASPTTAIRKENCENFLKLPPKSRSPKRMPSRRLSVATDFTSICSPGGHNKSALNNVIDDRALHEIQPHPVSEWKELLLDAQQGAVNQSLSFSERQKRWKEELDQELQRKREILRQAGLGGRTPSPREHIIIMQQRERVGLAFAGN